MHLAKGSLNLDWTKNISSSAVVPNNEEGQELVFDLEAYEIVSITELYSR